MRPRLDPNGELLLCKVICLELERECPILREPWVVLARHDSVALISASASPSFPHLPPSQYRCPSHLPFTFFIRVVPIFGSCAQWDL